MILLERALAQEFPAINPIDPGRFDSVSDVLLLVVNGFLILAGALAVIYIIWSGFQFITSAGNPEQAQKARNGILYAAIGIVIISLSFAIVGVVTNLVGSTGGTGLPPTPEYCDRNPTEPICRQGTSSPTSEILRERLPTQDTGTGQGGGPEGP